jgi:hypothetical protein
MVPVKKDFFNGHRCSDCGWVRPTPRLIPPGKSPKQDAKETFKAHDCAKYPLPATNRLP